MLQKLDVATKTDHLLPSVLDALTSNVAVLDQKGNVILTNAAWRQFAASSGLAWADAVLLENYLDGCDASQDASAAAASTVAQGIRQVINGERGSFFLEYSCLLPEGRRWFQTRVTRLNSGKGREVVVVHENITEVKEAEALLRRADGQLQKKNQESEEFIYAVSHDLKSPLVTIEGFAGHMRADLQSHRTERLPEFLDRIERAGRQMSRLIEQLLDLSCATQTDEAPAPVAPTVLARELARDCEPLLTAHNVDLIIQDNLPLIVAVPGQLRRVFQNLLDNALRYGCTAATPQVRIGGEVTDEEIRYFVADNGPGIPAEQQARVFEPFRRLPSDQPGTGMGLTIVKRIVEHHYGRVWIESEPNVGTTFWISFPRSERGTRAAAPPARAHHAG